MPIYDNQAIRGFVGPDGRAPREAVEPMIICGDFAHILSYSDLSYRKQQA